MFRINNDNINKELKLLLKKKITKELFAFFSKKRYIEKKLVFDRYTLEVKKIKEKFDCLIETFNSLIANLLDNFDQSINKVKLNVSKNLDKNKEEKKWKKGSSEYFLRKKLNDRKKLFSIEGQIQERKPFSNS